MDLFSKLIFYRAVQDAQYPVILMYHGIAPGNQEQLFKYAIDAHTFSIQLDFLKKNGWQTALVKDLLNPKKLPPKTIILTFDDGFKNNYKNAYQPLKQRGMCATFFIVSGCMGGYSTWLEDSKNEKMLNREQIVEMNSNGMEIGSHTVLHPDMQTLTVETAARELRQSKMDLEAIIKKPVISFAYPYGRFTNQTLELTQKAGYALACSVRPGWVKPGQNLFLLPRITIFSSDSLATFARKIAFATNDARWEKMLSYYKNRIKEKLRQ